MLKTLRDVVGASLVAWFATGCGASPTAPPGNNPQVLGNPATSQVRIAGIPPALSPGATAQLAAEAVLETGVVKECAAGWLVDDAKVASVSSSGLLTGRNTGYVNVSATCNGVTARAETKVEALRTYHVVIIPYDSEIYEPPVMKPLVADIEFLDGPRAGQKMRLASFYRDGMLDVTWPVKVRLTADGYEPKDVVLADNTGERPNQSSDWFDFWVPMTFSQDALTDTFVHELSPAEKIITYPVTLRAPGPVQVRTWWWGDYDSDLFVELTCDGKLLLGHGYWIGGPTNGIRGAGFTANVPADTACQVRVRQTVGYPRYRIAIRYAR